MKASEENLKTGGVKTPWQTPQTEVQCFQPNEYVASCGYKWNVECKTDADNGSYNYLYDDTNGNGKYDSGTDKRLYQNWWGFTGCGTTHEVLNSSKPSFNGFVVKESGYNQTITPVYWWTDSKGYHVCYDPASSKNVS